MDIDCGPHKQGRVDGVAGLVIHEFVARNRSLLIYNASFLKQPVLAFEYAPLGLVVRRLDGQLVQANDAAQSQLSAARVAWRDSMLACDIANAGGKRGMPFVQPRTKTGGAAWWIGNMDAQPWPFTVLKGDFAAQAHLATKLALALHRCRDRMMFHGNANPWAFVKSADGDMILTASLPDERGFLPFLANNDSLWQPGFSPPEMADGAKRLALGPWSDVYGISAMLFQAITGAPPPDWTQARDPHHWRSELSSLLDGHCLPKVQKIVLAGLSLDYAERPQTAEFWHAMMDIGALDDGPEMVLVGDPPPAVLLGTPVDLGKPEAVGAPAAPATPEPMEPVDPLTDPAPRQSYFGLMFVMAALLLIAAMGWAAMSLFGPSQSTEGQLGAPNKSPIATAPDDVADPEPMKPELVELPLDDEAEAVTEAARDIAASPTATPIAAPPPPKVILSAAPTAQASRSAARPSPRSTPSARATPAPRLASPSIKPPQRSAESEAETTRRLNAQQAAAARRQNEQNRLNAEAERRAKAERERKIAADQEAYRQRLAATEAERLRRERAYQDANSRWKADVAACKAGDTSRCAR